MKLGRQTKFTGLAAGLLMLLLSFVLVGCQTRDRNVLRTLPAPVITSHNAARLNVFLTLEEKQGPAIELTVNDLEVLIDDLWLPLSAGALTLDSTEIGNGQVLLGGVAVPPGQYRGLRMTVSEGMVRTASGQNPITLTKPQRIEVSTAKGLDLELGDSKTLLVSWDVESSLTPANTLAPQFFVTSALRNLPVNLVFAVCPEINTVFVVRADKNWVVDSFGLTGRPTYLGIEPSARALRFYALTADEKMVKVIDSSSFRVIDSYPTLNDEATYMTISPDGDWAYLVHEQSGYLSRMNLRTGQIDPRVKLGKQPNYAVYLEGQRLLAVSLGLSQTVLLLDPESLRVVKRISTGSNPEGLLVADNVLYVAEKGDSSVSTNDLTNVAAQSRLMVGFGPRRLVEAVDQIFVSNYKDGSLSVLIPGQLGTLQEIFGLGEPLEMIFDDFYRRIYVADRSVDGLLVIDTNSNQLIRKISLGAKPLGLAIIQ